MSHWIGTCAPLLEWAFAMATNTDNEKMVFDPSQPEFEMQKLF